MSLEDPIREFATGPAVLEGAVNSKGLARSEAYTIKGPVEGFFYNNKSAQDAFAIAEDEKSICAVVCDGVGSLRGSEFLSQVFSERSALMGLHIPAKDLFTDTNVREALLGSEEAGLGDIHEAATTTSIVQFDKINNNIHWASIGDSPILMIDTDENDQVTWWEILNNPYGPNSDNYTDPAIIEGFMDLKSYGLYAERGLPAPILPNRIASGTVNYRLGRKVVVASDFIIKILMHDQRAAEIQLAFWKNPQNKEDPSGHLINDERRARYIKYWVAAVERNETPQFDALCQIRADGIKQFNPLFFKGMSQPALHRLLADWTVLNATYSDDMTALLFDFDKLAEK